MIVLLFLDLPFYGLAARRLQREAALFYTPAKSCSLLWLPSPSGDNSLIVRARSSAERKVLITRDLRSQPVIHSIAALA
jgi:hypothetical protein